MSIDTDQETMPVTRNPFGNAPAPIPHQASVETSRAIEQVRGAIVMAKQFPRDQTSAYNRIMQSCSRHSFAEKAMFRYPRGEVVEGLSIRAAEEFARQWWNLDFGVVELERREGVSVFESYCWDLESNTRCCKQFEIEHIRYSKKFGNKKLTDPRDIYEIVANNGARRLRACILQCIPGDVQDDAIAAIRETLRKGDGTPLIDRIRKMVVAFSELSVSQEAIEARLGHAIADTSADELIELTSIYQSIKSGQYQRQKFFDLGKAPNISEELNERYKESVPEPEREPKKKTATKAAAKKESESDSEIPVPLDEKGGKTDWIKWEREYKIAINKCTNMDALNILLRENKSIMERLLAESPEKWQEISDYRQNHEEQYLKQKTGGDKPLFR